MIPSSDTVDKTITEVINAFAQEKWAEGKEGLQDLASWYKSSGAGVETFIDLCTYIENEAVGKSGNEFIRTKIGLNLRMGAA